MKIVITDHLGNTYESIEAMCKQYGIKKSVYIHRIEKGLSIKDALTIRYGDSKICEDHLGNKYCNIGEMCKAYGITRAKLSYRLKANWSLEDALTKPDCVYVPCKDHTGKQFNCVSDMCRNWGVSLAKYNHRIENGMSIEQALTTPDMSNNLESTDHLGNHYNSKTDMCNAWNVNRHTFSDRMDRGWSLEEALTGNKKRINPKAKKCSDHLGNEYETIVDMCNAYGVNYKIYKRRISLGWTIREALSEKDNPIKPNSKACKDHLGNEFASIVEMCKYWHITPDLHKGRLKDGWTLEETLTIPKLYSLGEYRVSVVLNEFINTNELDGYFHNITIKKAFDYMELSEYYKSFIYDYEDVLKKNEIKVSRQKIAKFRFDFTLIKNCNIFAFIEFDGEQHFRFVDLFFKTFELFLKRHTDDLAKNLLSESLNIPLLRIRYDQIDTEKIRVMVSDLLKCPNKYIVQHNTYLSNEEYMSVFEDRTNNVFEKNYSMA